MHEKPLMLAAPPRGFLEHTDPRLKMGCLLVWVLCVVTTPAGRGILFALDAVILLLLLVANWRLFGKFARRFLAAWPFIATLCALLPFFKQGPPVWQWGPLIATQPGLEQAYRIGAVALLCVAAMSLVWASTSETGLLIGLRGVGLPASFVVVIGFMLRYLHVLRPELHRLTDARAERSIGPHGPGRLRSGANVLGTLFLRSHDRAERVADAMAARCFDGQSRLLMPDHWHVEEVAFSIVFVGIVVALRVILGELS